MEFELSTTANDQPPTESVQDTPLVSEPKSTEAPKPHHRITIRGKFLFAGERKFTVRGVTYGPFRPEADGSEYHTEVVVRHDFESMVEHGFNTVRLYTVPPRWLLDVAGECGLKIVVGLPWEQHVTFLDDGKITRGIVEKVRSGVRQCAGHPSILAYTVGNEIPAAIVRWHGPRAIEAFLKRLFHAAKAEDPEALVTYVSYPSTEYLDLPFFDFTSFNVFLETQERLDSYLARLQNIAGDRPLVMTEIGLDSLRNGESQQAETLAWQVRTVLKNGCAGTFMFSWCDEWFRGGVEIEDWAFGLVDRQRQPKPALAAVRHAFHQSLNLSTPFEDLSTESSPAFISVVVCTYNGSSTLRECLNATSKIDYPHYEVVVINDGSTDGTADIIKDFDVRCVQIPNGGLSNARNLGYQTARGEIVAYIDDDAYPDIDWLSHLNHAFQSSEHAGIGGPNIPPSGDGWLADCVANAPGGPSHVLISDRMAEHIPGCNMAFRKDVLAAVGGFDVQFRIAGDDVDLCWRILASGHTIGFNAGAMVWHHRRGSVKRYLKQQFNYGKAEGMLEAKWPEKYNRLGHPHWSGRLYGRGHTQALRLRSRRIHHGVWGSHLFQVMYDSDGTMSQLAMMPEWFLLIFALGVVSLLGLLWTPLLAALPFLALSCGITLVQAIISARSAQFIDPPRTTIASLRSRAMTGLLHLLQPLSRLFGRLSHRLTPFRLKGAQGWAFPRRRTFRIWDENWRQPAARIVTLESRLKEHRVLVRCGGEQDRWDLQAECGLLGGVRLLTAVEEHGQGRQLFCVAARPRAFRSAWALIPLFALFAALAAFQGAWAATIILSLTFFLLSLRTLHESGSAMHAVILSLQELDAMNSKASHE